MVSRTIFIIWYFANQIIVTYITGKRIVASIEDIHSVFAQYADRFITIKPGNIIRRTYKIKTKAVFQSYYIILVIISVLSIFASFECIMFCYTGGFTKEIFLTAFYIHSLRFLLPEQICHIFVHFHCKKVLKDKKENK